MSESIVIKISDAVDSSIETKLKGIANSAKLADSNIEALKSELLKVQSGEISKLNEEMLKSALASEKLKLAQAKANNELTRSSIAAQKLNYETAKASTQQQRLATETARTATAQANAANAVSRSEVAAIRLDAAQSRASNSMILLEKRADKLKTSLDPSYAAQEAFNNAIREASTLYKRGAIDIDTYEQAISSAKANLSAGVVPVSNFTKNMNEMGESAKLQKHHLLNLGYQVQDIGVSLASGMHPLTVFIQQGAQISGIAAQAGVSMWTMVGAAGSMVLKFAPLAIAIGAGYGALKLFQSEVAKEDELKKYAESLGATKDQIEDLDLATITFTDTMQGLWAVINDSTDAEQIFSDLGESAKNTFKFILDQILQSASFWIATVQTAVGAMVHGFESIKSPVYDTFVDLVNSVISLLEQMRDGAVSIAQDITNAFRNVMMLPEVTFSTDAFERMSYKTGESTKQEFDVLDELIRNQKDNVSGFYKFVDKVGAATLTAHNKRVKSALDDSKAKKAASGGSKVDRAGELEKINRDLEQQIYLNGLLKDQREVESKYLSIENSLRDKGIKLSKSETASIVGKIEAMRDSNLVASQMDDIYSELIQPIKDFEAANTAANVLLQAGAINQRQFTEQLRKAEETYKSAVDPLYQYNKELFDNIQLAKALPQDKERFSKMQQISNDLLQKGIVLTKAESKELQTKIRLLEESNKISEAEVSIYQKVYAEKQAYIDQLKAINNLKSQGQDTGNAVNDVLQSSGLDTTLMQSQIDFELSLIQNKYDLIESMREKDFISEQEYTALKGQLAAKEFETKHRLASSFFDQLSELSGSSFKELGKLGQAAAITQAIINTYEGATKALAQGGIYGSAMAAVVVAQGMSQVAQIRSQGFKKGGYTGDMPTGAVAGTVHGQEYVFDAEATKRIGVGNLEALRKGTEIATNNSVNNAVTNMTTNNNSQQITNENNLKIVNVIDPAIVGNFMSSSAGEKVFMNVVKNNATLMKRVMENA